MHTSAILFSGGTEENRLFKNLITNVTLLEMYLFFCDRFCGNQRTMGRVTWCLKNKIEKYLDLYMIFILTVNLCELLTYEDENSTFIRLLT